MSGSRTNMTLSLIWRYQAKSLIEPLTRLNGALAISHSLRFSLRNQEAQYYRPGRFEPARSVRSNAVQANPVKVGVGGSITSLTIIYDQ
jgi:hypothetical protein